MNSWDESKDVYKPCVILAKARVLRVPREGRWRRSHSYGSISVFVYELTVVCVKALICPQSN